MRFPAAVRARSGWGDVPFAPRPPRAAGGLVLALGLLTPSLAAAWVSAYIERVDVAVVVAADGTAVTTSTAAFVIEAGKFRELELLGVSAEVEPDLAASYVEDDKGRRYGIEPFGRRLADGTLRFVLAAAARIPKGRAWCRLVVRENWLAGGRARIEGDDLLVDWHPPVWPDGMERMTVQVTFAAAGPALEFSVPEDLVSELEPRSSGRTLTLSKFRPAASYVLPVRFSARPSASGGPALVASAAASDAAPARPHRSRPPTAREQVDVLPFLVAFPLLGGLLLGLRVRWTRRVASAEGGTQSYLLWPAIGVPVRWPLLAAGLAAGAWLLARGDLLGGFSLQAAAVLLGLPDRFRWLERGGAGCGPWRALAAPSPRTWRSLAAAAHRARRSWLDFTGPAGFLLLLVLAGATAAAMYLTLWDDARAWIVAGADAALLLLPPFLVGPERALPPVLPAEAGVALERVRRSIRSSAEAHGLDLSFLVQDDRSGRPADLRMRVRRPAARLARSAEVAVEWRFTRWGWHATYAVLLDLPAGSRLRAGPSGFPRDAACRLADDLVRETWALRSPTPRAAARRLLRTMRVAEELLVPKEAPPAETADVATVPGRAAAAPALSPRAGRGTSSRVEPRPAA